MAKYEELKNGAIFGAGEPNPYGKFFIGDTFLKGLAKSPDEKLSIGMFMSMVTKFCWSLLAKVGTKKMVSQLKV